MAEILTSLSIDKDARSYRLTSIDFLRGLVIVIMAIDHVRDHFMVGGVPDPMNSPDLSVTLYLTRWITHFCAPVFVFLAGTSAGLMSFRKSKNELGGFLLKRGIWLIVVEILLITPIVTLFGRGIDQLSGILIVFQVIWAIGASMVVLSFVQYLGTKTTLTVGLFIIFGHNLLGYIWPEPEGISPFWFSLYTQSLTVVGPS